MSDPVAGDLSRGARTGQLAELLLFLLLVLPGLAVGLSLLRPAELTFVSVALHTIALQLGLLAVVLAFVRRRGEPLRGLGLGGMDRLAREAQWGVLLFVPVYVGAALLESLLRAAGLSGLDVAPDFLVPVGAAQLALAMVFLVVVAVAEEVVFRGYLILRLRALLGSPAGAIVVAAVIFALGHGYQGSAGVVTVGALGVVFGLVYLWRGSLIAPMVMHFLQNFMGIVLVPLAFSH